MSFDIDSFIVASFLLVTLIVGLKHGTKIKTIKDYALGGRDFSSGAIIATLVATWISGSFLFGSLAQIYAEGTVMVVAYLFLPANFLIMGYYFIPRMQEFLGNLSIAESMGSIYGKQVEIITAITGVIGCIGIVAVQFKIFATLFSLILPINSPLALVICSAVIILYSTFGGIKAVTVTDVVQFFTFSTFIPVLIFVLVQDVPFSSNVYEACTNHFADFNKVFDHTDAKFSSFITLLFYFTFPNFAPEIYQRILIAKDIEQSRRSFFVAFLVCLAIVIMVIIVAVLTYCINPDIEPNNIINYILSHYFTPGIQGLVIIGILAMIMSTSDSNLNSSAVLVTDIISFFKVISPDSHLTSAKIFSLLLGVIAILLALSESDLLSIILTTASFYFPIVNPPLMLAILGFRTSVTSVLIGMSAGFATVISYLIFYKTKDAIIPALTINFIFLIGSHYLLRQKGGWIGIKNPEPLHLIRKERTMKIKKLIQQIKNFNFITFCVNNSPKEDKAYSFFGIFCFVTTISTIYSINTDLMLKHKSIIFLIYKTMLVLSTCFMLYPMWSERIKHRAVVGVLWNICLVYILAFCSSLFALLSQFGKLQLVIFTLNMAVIFILSKWRVAIIMVLFGYIGAIEVYKYCMELGTLHIIFGDVYFHIIYLILLLSTVLITVIQPKQQQEEATEQKAEYFEKKTHFLKSQNECAKREIDNLAQGIDLLEEQFTQKRGQLKAKEVYLRDQLKLMRSEVAKLQELKNEFVRNVPHEINTPMTAVLSLSEVLYSCYDSSDADKIKEALKAIVNGGDRLKSYVNNIANLSKLSSLSYDLNKKELNLGQLIKERTVLYKKLFTDDDNKQEFKFDIAKNVMVYCDEYYITQAIDNLISNANKYGEGKPIEISLHKKEDGNIEFTITDKGMGIPQDELISIFDKFTVSSKTRSPAGGRGVGLALCQKIIKIHGGTIWAESDGKNGSTFYFIIPIAV